jgi:hypothetical protein
MEKETLKRIFEFLKNKEGKKVEYQDTFIWKHIFNEPFPEEDLNVEGDLDLRYSIVKSLPKGLIVWGDLQLFASTMKSLPEGLYVKGSLYLSHTPIELLPDNLYVGGDLWVRYSKIAEIPKNLYVVGDLYIEETPIAEIYTDEEIRKNKNLNKGLFNGNIIR